MGGRSHQTSSLLMSCNQIKPWDASGSENLVKGSVGVIESGGDIRGRLLREEVAGSGESNADFPKRSDFFQGQENALDGVNNAWCEVV